MRGLSRDPPASNSHVTSKERARLRSLAHELRPTAHVGKDGVTPAVVDGLRQALRTRELVKIRVLEAAPASAAETAHALAAAVDGASVVQTMGRNAVLYRPAPDDD